MPRPIAMEPGYWSKVASRYLDSIARPDHRKAVESHIRSLEANGRSPKTLATYLRQLTPFANFFDQPFTRLTREDIDRFFLNGLS